MSEKDLLLIEKLERQQLLITETFQKEIKDLQEQIEGLKNPTVEETAVEETAEETAVEETVEATEEVAVEATEEVAVEETE